MIIIIFSVSCCVNRICWNITSKGLACVGQDEVVFLIETLPDETQIPKDVLIHINQLYVEATKGNFMYYNYYDSEFNSFKFSQFNLFK